MSVASLPMYDWPEVRTETDALWASLREAIRARGVDAPEALDRIRDSPSVWVDPDLTFSQTCGMPWRLGLHRDAALIGTPDYGLDGCAPGYYTSAIVVREDDPREQITDFQNAVCAFNASNSQSGYAAMLSLARDASFFQWQETGAHAASILSVANAQADIAAIDAVTWRFAQRFMPEAVRLRVLAHSQPTPGLPYITSKSHDAGLLAEATSEAIASLDDEVRAALGLVGLAQISSETYLHN